MSHYFLCKKDNGIVVARIQEKTRRSSTHAMIWGKPKLCSAIETYGRRMTTGLHINGMGKGVQGNN
jgi:hypothetical protein